MNFSVISSIS